MLRLRGQEPIPLPAPFVAARLGDAAWLAAALPDTDFLAGDPDRAHCRHRIRGGPLTGTADSWAEIAGRNGEAAVSYRIVTEGAGGRGVVAAELRFEPHGAGRVVVHWSAELVETGGLLRFAPGAALRGVAEGLVPKVWDALGRQLLSEHEV